MMMLVRKGDCAPPPPPPPPFMCLCLCIGRLSNDDDDGDINDNGKKAIGLDWQNNSCTCITLFCTFFSRRCTTTVGKCLISRFVEDGNTRQQLSFSFPEL